MKRLVKKLHGKIHCALKGLWYVGRRELSFRLEILISLALITYAYAAAWPLWKWLVLAGWLVIILFAEMVNTVLERLLDLMEPRLSEPVGLLKDILAGAVLWLIIGAGFIIVWLIAV